ncbi:MAG: family transcriptional regulator, cyclic receptor protein [Actinomycetota bacterium]|jgi:cAMP-dependent protein kinase regulator|nr:family transcriptional regulator, cyclic receptor protein [Actinomycetota bacterium]
MARQSDLIAHLGEVPLFSHCSKRDLQTLARNTEVLEFPEGARVVSQGEAGNAFYVLLDGSAIVARNGQRVGELQPGDYFGELALLDPAPRNADVVAQTPVSVARLLVKPFRQMLRDVPAMNERLLGGLARRLRDADRRDSH